MVYTWCYHVLIFFYVGLRYLYETLNTSFPNIICYEYQRYRPTLLRTTIFVTC